MQLIPLPHPWPRPRRHSDTLRLAFCLIFFATLARAAVPPPFSTFLQENASIFFLAPGSAGHIYTFGVLSSGTLFVSRLDPGATRIAFTLRLGGSDGERGGAMTVDGAGNMYITGSTASSDFPFNPQPPAASGKQYPFVVKVDSTGRVVYSFLLEHTAAAFSAAIAVDSDGSAVVTGYALEPGFPSAGGGYSSTIDPTFSGGYFRPFIARVDPSGTKLLSSALGAGGAHISIGPGGDIFVAGNVSGFGIGDPAKSYPVTSGAFQTTFTPSFDCSFPCQLVFPSPEQYVTRLDSALTKLVYSTFLTGTHGANNSALAVDPDGNAYVTGTTNSTDYPYSSVQPSAPRPGVFLTKLDPTGSKLLWSVQQGGDLLAFDAANHLTVAGSVFPADGLPYQHATYPPSPPAGDIPAACQQSGGRGQRFPGRGPAIPARHLSTVAPGRGHPRRLPAKWLPRAGRRIRATLQRPGCRSIGHPVSNRNPRPAIRPGRAPRRPGAGCRRVHLPRHRHHSRHALQQRDCPTHPVRILPRCLRCSYPIDRRLTGLCRRWPYQIGRASGGSRPVGFTIRDRPRGPDARHRLHLRTRSGARVPRRRDRDLRWRGGAAPLCIFRPDQPQRTVGDKANNIHADASHSRRQVGGLARLCRAEERRVGKECRS